MSLLFVSAPKGDRDARHIQLVAVGTNPSELVTLIALPARASPIRPCAVSTANAAAFAGEMLKATYFAVCRSEKKLLLRISRTFTILLAAICGAGFGFGIGFGFALVLLHINIVALWAGIGVAVVGFIAGVMWTAEVTDSVPRHIPHSRLD